MQSYPFNYQNDAEIIVHSLEDICMHPEWARDLSVAYPDGTHPYCLNCEWPVLRGIMNCPRCGADTHFKMMEEKRRDIVDVYAPPDFFSKLDFK